MATVPKLNTEEKKKLGLELSSAGFLPAAVDVALEKVPAKYDHDRAAQWCVDWLLAHPDGDDAPPLGRAKSGHERGSKDDNVSQIMAMGFSKEDAEHALETNDVEHAIMFLLSQGEKEAEERKKRMEEERKKKAEAEKEEKRKKAAVDFHEKNTRRKRMNVIYFRQVCQYHPTEKRSAPKTDEERDKQAKQDIKDKVGGEMILGSLYEPIDEEEKYKKEHPDVVAKKTAPASKIPDIIFSGSSPPPPDVLDGGPAAAAAGGGLGPAAARLGVRGGRRGGRGGGPVTSVAASGAGAPPSSGGKSDAPKKDGPKILEACKVCYCDFDGRDCKRVNNVNCGHSIICTECFRQYIKIKIRDKEILPWITCADTDCKVPLHPRDIFSCGVTTDEVYQFLMTFFTKNLSREPQWIECKTAKCPYGFWLEEEELKTMEKKNNDRKGSGKKDDTCPVCNKKQSVEPRKEELDEEFKKLIAEGKMRDCPRCKMFTLKEFGLCNIIECAKCGIWWNWRTRDTGRTSRELKDRARSAHSLWEPGELEYQMKLESSNPEAFRALLERSGIKWKAGYQRGGGE